jgi:hypothetical protein
MRDILPSEAILSAVKITSGLAGCIGSDGKARRYLTDTGRSWGGEHSVRDVMLGAEPVPVETTDDLTCWIESSGAEGLYLTVHPERWAVSGGEWAVGSLTDFAVNMGKTVLQVMRA